MHTKTCINVVRGRKGLKYVGYIIKMSGAAFYKFDVIIPEWLSISPCLANTMACFTEQNFFCKMHTVNDISSWFWGHTWMFLPRKRTSQYYHRVWSSRTRLTMQKDLGPTNSSSYQCCFTMDTFSNRFPKPPPPFSFRCLISWRETYNQSQIVILVSPQISLTPFTGSRVHQ